MFTEGRWYLVGVLLLFSVILRQTLLFVISLVLLLAALVSYIWDRYSLRDVEYRRIFGQRRAFFGEEVEMTIEVVNRKLLPLAWLEIEDEIPTVMQPLNGYVAPTHREERRYLTNMLSVRWYECVRRHYRMRCDHRGFHTFGPATLHSGDVFGFSTRSIVVPDLNHLLVYPRIVPIAELGLPARDPFGDFPTRRWLLEDPLRKAGVRDYVQSDDPRRIHWKATARQQGLQVKIFEPTTTQRLVIFLNLHSHGAYWWSQSYHPDLLELGIITAASVASWAVEQGYQVGLSANGYVHHGDRRVRVAPASEPEQLVHILESLARLMPFASIQMAQLLLEESHALAYGSTLALITAMLDEETVATLDLLRARGHAIAVMLIGDDAPRLQLPGVRTYRIGGEGQWRTIEELTLGAGRPGH